MKQFMVIILWALTVPSAAEAGPVVGALQVVGTWLTATFGATIAGAIVNIGTSLLLGMLLKPRTPKQSDLIRELMQPDSLPLYRFVYGRTWAPGTPAPVRSKGRNVYACYLLNSRPSAGPFTLYLDKREVEYSGDPYNFSGPGAQATNDPFDGLVTYWIGRGNQVSPPSQILSEASEHYQPSDGWRGRTVIWLKINLGSKDKAGEVWPNSPPEVLVDGLWSLVKDPRNPLAAAQWSDNQALCVLDALRGNPIRPYDDRHLWLDTFAWAADVADLPFAVKGGDTLPMFRVNGILVFADNIEIEDQVTPLVEAGASLLSRTGGRLGLVPAIYQPPVGTITDVLDDAPMTFNRYRPLSSLATEVSALYIAPDRAYEEATTPTYVLAGAEEENGIRNPVKYELRMVTDHRQAQFVAAIMGRRTLMQKSWSGVVPGDHYDKVAGSPVLLDLPEPYQGRNGEYLVSEIHVGFDPLGTEGVAMRIPLSLTENSPLIYSWNPAMDEQDVEPGEFDPNIKGVQPPTNLVLTSNASTKLGNTPRVKFTFLPSPSQSVGSYVWEYSTLGSTEWLTGGTVYDDDGTAATLFGYLSPVTVGVSYRIRVRARRNYNLNSSWVVSDYISAQAGTSTVPAPTPVDASGGSGSITMTFRSPNNPDYRGIEIYEATSNNPGSATKVTGPIYNSPNSTYTYIRTGLPPFVSRWYFARSVDNNQSLSPLGTGISATTTT